MFGAGRNDLSTVAPILSLPRAAMGDVSEIDQLKQRTEQLVPPKAHHYVEERATLWRELEADLAKKGNDHCALEGVLAAVVNGLKVAQHYDGQRERDRDYWEQRKRIEAALRR